MCPVGAHPVVVPQEDIPPGGFPHEHTVPARRAQRPLTVCRNEERPRRTDARRGRHVRRQMRRSPHGAWHNVAPAAPFGARYSAKAMGRARGTLTTASACSGCNRRAPLDISPGTIRSATDTDQLSISAVGRAIQEEAGGTPGKGSTPVSLLVSRRRRIDGGCGEPALLPGKGRPTRGYPGRPKGRCASVPTSRRTDR